MMNCKNINLISALSLIIMIGMISCMDGKSDKEISCSSQSIKDYTLLEENGIFREQFDSTNIGDSRYTDNNTVFKSGTSYLYKFEHVSSGREQFFFKYQPTNDNHFTSWVFVPADSAAGNTIKHVKITVQPGLEPMIYNDPKYDQSVIRFEYPVEEGQTPFSSHSGVIENEKNIWMHPPRDQYFRILELNPFPFIKTPYEVGNQWKWELEIGSFWGDKRWKVWEGSITNHYDYEITQKKKVHTSFGSLEVYEITATATSRIGQTQLRALFNKQYGFVELNYRNIDGSRTILELVEHSGFKG